MKNGRCPPCDAFQTVAGVDVFPKRGPFTGNPTPISLTALAPQDNDVCGRGNGFRPRRKMNHRN